MEEPRKASWRRRGAGRRPVREGCTPATTPIAHCRLSGGLPFFSLAVKFLEKALPHQTAKASGGDKTLPPEVSAKGATVFTQNSRHLRLPKSRRPAPPTHLLEGGRFPRRGEAQRPPRTRCFHRQEGAAWGRPPRAVLRRTPAAAVPAERDRALSTWHGPGPGLLEVCSPRPLHTTLSAHVRRRRLPRNAASKSQKRQRQAPLQGEGLRSPPTGPHPWPIRAGRLDGKPASRDIS